MGALARIATCLDAAVLVDNKKVGCDASELIARTEKGFFHWFWPLLLLLLMLLSLIIL